MRALPLAAVLATLLVLSGCLGGPNRDDLAAPPLVDGLPLAEQPVTAAPLAGQLHDLSPLLEGVTFQSATIEQYRTPVAEFIELDTWVARPKVEGPVPLVLEVTPYYGGGAPQGLGRVGTELIARGYAVGVSSVRGTGQSGGCFTQGGPGEAKDTAAVIEHLAGQPWSNGNVGVMGVSYPGTTPQDVWVEAPPSLKAIVPISGISDLYKYNFVNGVHISPQGYAFNAYYWILEGPTAATVADGDPRHSAMAAAGEVCLEQVEVQEGGATSGLDGNKDAYWQVRDFHAELRASWDKNPQRAAVWYIHGLQDWNVKPHMMEEWLDAIQESGVPYKVWLGQWPHAWPAPTAEDALCEFDNETERGAACRADWWDHGVVAWFDQFLKGIDTGILDAPRVQVQDDDGRWHHAQVWPPRASMPHRFHLSGDGTLRSEPGQPGSLSYHDGFGAVTETPAILDVNVAPLQARWVAAEPFAQDMLVSGYPVFHGNLTSSGPRANLVVSLGEQAPDGSTRFFNYCVLSLNHAASLQQGDLDIRDQRQEVNLRCFPQDDVVHAGNHLVVVAAGNAVGSPSPGLQPQTYGSTITIDTAGAWIELPVDHAAVYEDPQPYANQYSLLAA